VIAAFRVEVSAPVAAAEQAVPLAAASNQIRPDWYDHLKMILVLCLSFCVLAQSAKHT
jgi:hypothetical protein